MCPLVNTCRRRKSWGGLRSIGMLEPVTGPAGNGPATYSSFRGRRRHDRRDHANEPRLLRSLQPHETHCEWPAASCLFGDIQTNLRNALRSGLPVEPLVRATLAIKPERHALVQGSSSGSGGLLALSQVGG